jgi:hypothetical protein
MTSKLLNVTALSPFITYTGAWEANAGATVNGSISVVPPPSRNLQNGSGTLKVDGFSERYYNVLSDPL